ncbi:hypothetical protein ABIE13_001319 [Ottowia thiooxydans]|uniref:Uncharacterized protein n=1 Tax=Ottowia thiooxydans TaxID=219182 RepID=A0ABV2Q5A5_9BURK
MVIDQTAGARSHFPKERCAPSFFPAVVCSNLPDVARLPLALAQLPGFAELGE